MELIRKIYSTLAGTRKDTLVTKGAHIVTLLWRCGFLFQMTCFMVDSHKCWCLTEMFLPDLSDLQRSLFMQPTSLVRSLLWKLTSFISYQACTLPLGKDTLMPKFLHSVCIWLIFAYNADNGDNVFQAPEPCWHWQDSSTRGGVPALSPGWKPETGRMLVTGWLHILLLITDLKPEQDFTVYKYFQTSVQCLI